MSDFERVPVDGPLSDEQVATLERSNLDVDALFTIAVDGPYSPEQLVELSKVDVGRLASAIHSIPVDGPYDPAEVVQLSRIDTARIEPLSPSEAVRLASR